MNTIDLIICLVWVLAVWGGWQRGLILQLCSLAGLVAAIWLASRYGVAVGGWLHLDESVLEAGGFVVVLLTVVIAVAIVGRLLRGIFHFAGFGVPDSLLGVVVSVAKYTLLLSVFFSTFASFNEGYSLCRPQVFVQSKLYKPVMCTSDALFPFLEWACEKLPEQKS